MVHGFVLPAQGTVGNNRVAIGFALPAVILGTARRSMMAASGAILVFWV